MTGIYYFPRYSQRENFVTSNTLLLLHRLYDINRHRFKRFIEALIGDEASDLPESLGLRIQQQIASDRSVLDGFLVQQGLRIGIETKLSASTFYVDQIRRHLSAFLEGEFG